MNIIEEQEQKKKFERFFVSTYPKVKMFAWKLLKSEDDAEDIAQDVFIKIWSNPELWESNEKNNAYIYTIVRNQIYNFIRHKKIVDNYRDSYASDFTVLQEVDGYDKIYAKEIELLLKLAIEKMPDQRRKVFLMSRRHNLSNQQIADSLGVSVRTVERHIYLALFDLKKIIFLFLLFIVNKHF